MKQSKKSSMLEIGLNTGSGFIVSLIITTLLLPYMETVGAFGITCIFTVVSLLRSYAWRRFFNNRITLKRVHVKVMKNIV